MDEPYKIFALKVLQVMSRGALEIWVTFKAFKPTSTEKLVTITQRKNVLEAEPWKFGLHFEPSSLFPLKSL